METTTLPPPKDTALGRPVPAWQGLLLGLIAGALVWGVVQSVHPLFRVPEQFHIAGLGAPVEQHVAFRREQDRVDRWHATLYLGSLGLLLGLLMGGRVAVARRAAAAVLLALPLGLLGGAASGFLAPRVYVWARDTVGSIELLQIVLAQCLVGVPLGLLLGLGIGIARGGVQGAVRGLLSGAVGGVLFAMAYPLVVSIALPTASTDVLLPEEAVTRLLWLAMLGGFVGVFAARS